MPAEDLAPAIELFRHRFLHALRHGKHISPSRLADLLSWKHSSFHIKGGALPPGAHAKGMRKPSPSTVRRLLLGNQLSPTFGMRPPARPRYLYSNKTRGQPSLIPDRIIRPPESSPNLKSPISNLQSTILLIPAPPKQSARSMRPLWRDLILKVWGADPLQCPCCKAPMKLAGAVKRPEQVELFLRLHGLWEGVIQLARPPPPPSDIETMESIK